MLLARQDIESGLESVSSSQRWRAIGLFVVNVANAIIVCFAALGDFYAWYSHKVCQHLKLDLSNMTAVQAHRP